MKTKILLLTLAVLLAIVRLFAQQDAQFSQYMFNGLYINPAYAGYKEEWNLNLFYRNQWTGFDQGPKTFSASADGTVRDHRIGLGFQISNDKLGLQSNTALYGNYAFRIPLHHEEQTISIGIGIGMLQQHLDKASMVATDPNDPTIAALRNNSILPDARFGIYYASPTFYAGLSADNLIAGGIKRDNGLASIVALKPHFYVIAGALFTLSDDLQLKPSLLIKDDLAGPVSCDISSFLLIDKLVWLGASYRTAIARNHVTSSLPFASAWVAALQIMASERLRVGYAYDKSLQATGMSAYPTHELSVMILFPSHKYSMLSPRYF